MTLFHSIQDLNWDDLKAENETPQQGIRITWRFFRSHVWIGRLSIWLGFPTAWWLQGTWTSCMAAQASKHVCSMLGLRWKQHCLLCPSFRVSQHCFPCHLLVKAVTSLTRFQGRGHRSPLLNDRSVKKFVVIKKKSPSC